MDFPRLCLLPSWPTTRPLRESSLLSHNEIGLDSDTFHRPPFSTALHPKFGANDGQPLRIHLEKKLVPPSLELNFYAKVVATHSDRKAINGYLHEIDHPLLPPPSVLDGAFFVRAFDTFTTAIQKVRLDVLGHRRVRL